MKFCLVSFALLMATASALVPSSVSKSPGSKLFASPTNPPKSSKRILPLPASSPAPPLTTTPNKKVALLVEPTPFTHVSGYANRFNEMLKYMSKAGDDVTIVTTDDTKDKPEEAWGYPITNTLGFRFPLYNHICVTFDLPELKGLRICEEFKPDIIHVTSPGFLLFAGFIYARILRVPLVMSYHTHLPNYAIKYLGFIPGIESFAWSLIRFAHQKADLTLTTSPQIRQELVDHGVPRVDVWRKGIDVDRFQPKFKSQEMRMKMSDGNPDDFLMTYVGRLGAEKRLRDIKPILEELGPGVRLAIVGKGPDEDALKKHFEGMPVVFTGQLSGDDLSAAFASADCFCMPSDSETLGFVVLESMASGVPVVGARAGGIPDLIDDGRTSFLAEPGNTEEFCEKLRKLMDHTFREEMGRSARAEAERWGWEAATSVLRNVQYELAIQNFRTRVLGGFGGVRTRFYSRVFRLRVAKIIRALKGLLGISGGKTKGV